MRPLVLSLLLGGWAIGPSVTGASTHFNASRIDFLCQTQFDNSNPVKRFGSALDFVLDTLASDDQRRWLQWLRSTQQNPELPPNFNPSLFSGVTHALSVRVLNPLYAAALSNPGELRAALAQLLHARGAEVKSRKQVERKVQSHFHPMDFRKIILNGTELELMTTHVTRAQWRVLQRKPNPGGDEAGDHDFPVTRTSHREVAAFVSRMNEPRYRRRLIQNGLLDHGTTNSYYRLLVDEEVKQLLDLIRKEYPGLLTRKNPQFDFPGLKEYSWILEGSQTFKLQPVAQRLPLVLGGHAFYDLWGLVREHVPFLRGDLHPIIGDVTYPWSEWGLSTDQDPRHETDPGRPFYDVLAPREQPSSNPDLMVSFRLVRVTPQREKKRF